MTATHPAILIVDDEEDTCVNLRDILSEFGYRVDFATSGTAALALFDRSHYDVALIDLRMPGIDGLELYRRIRQVGSGTVGIIISAYASREAAQAALDAGAWRILAKPVEMSSLAKLIDQALGQPLVLVVDDDHAMCASLLDVLEDQGYRACLATNIGRATEQLRQRDYQVVLIDMKLPEGTGDEVYRLVRGTNPDARTILITGFRDETEALMSRVLAEGADAVCYKPFDMDQLLGAIRRLAAHTPP